MQYLSLDRWWRSSHVIYLRPWNGVSNARLCAWPRVFNTHPLYIFLARKKPPPSHGSLPSEVLDPDAFAVLGGSADRSKPLSAALGSPLVQNSEPMSCTIINVYICIYATTITLTCQIRT
jgi:hypothetical protein